MAAVGRVVRVTSGTPYLGLLQAIDGLLRDAGFQVPSPPPAAETDTIEARVAHYDPAGPFDDAPRFQVRAVHGEMGVFMLPWHGASAAPLDIQAAGFGNYFRVEIDTGANVYMAADGRQGWAWIGSDAYGVPSLAGIARIRRYPSDLTEGVAARYLAHGLSGLAVLARAMRHDGAEAGAMDLVRNLTSPLTGSDSPSSALSSLVAPCFVTSGSLDSYLSQHPQLMGEVDDILKTSASGPFMHEVIPGFGLVTDSNGMRWLIRRPPAFDPLPDV